MDKFNVNQVYSSIDLQGRYRYSNQPFVAPWNLSRLAETLLPIIDKNKDNYCLIVEEKVYNNSIYISTILLTTFLLINKS